PLRPQGTRSVPKIALPTRLGDVLRYVSPFCALGLLLALSIATAQVVTVDTKTGVVTNGASSENAQVDRRYRQVTPTHVVLPNSELDAKTRLELIRALDAEQGFAMRPFPRGHRGLTLAANGKLNPAGEAYLNLVVSEGLSAKPGDRVVLSDIKIDHSRIVFDLNGGPDPKHRFLRHIQVGAGPTMNPVVQDEGQEPVGARVTLAFSGHIPELTGADVKALLAPLISFDVKTPVQAFTDTLPTKLKDAILNHHVLVGMDTEMVLFAKGPPEHKTREIEGQTPFEEWIYGQAPQPVEFVRFNGNNVIRLEVAKVGEKPVIFTKNEVEGLMRTDGTPLVASTAHTKTTAIGDVERNPDTQAPNAPPTLRNPGEKLPDHTQSGQNGEMRPVRFPAPKPAAQPGSNPDGEPDAQSPAQSPNAAKPPVSDASETTPPTPQADAPQTP
ncbi:MAG: hypothetical protein WBQ94_22735, partial [Terracidiphilus sp.]